mgnify:CR=1 FL=1
MCYHRVGWCHEGTKARGLCRFGSSCLRVFVADPGRSWSDRGSRRRSPGACARALQRAQFDCGSRRRGAGRAWCRRRRTPPISWRRAPISNASGSVARPTISTNARERFRRLNPGGFSPRERTGIIVGPRGDVVFRRRVRCRRDGIRHRAAAEPQTTLPSDARDRVADWWATAIDRDAKPRPESERLAASQRDPIAHGSRARARR